MFFLCGYAAQHDSTFQSKGIALIHLNADTNVNFGLIANQHHYVSSSHSAPVTSAMKSITSIWGRQQYGKKISCGIDKVSVRHSDR